MSLEILRRPSGLLIRNSELGNDYIVAPIFKVDLYRRANPYPLALRYGQIGNHQQHGLLQEFNNDIDEGCFRFETWHVPLMHHGERMDSACTADRFEAQLLRHTRIAYTSRRMIIIT